MGLLFDILFGSQDNEQKSEQDWDYSVFDTDRFKCQGSSNWVDWEDVSTGEYNGGGFEHPNYDDEGEW